MLQADRPARLIVVVGTGTEVGKTWASTKLLSHARSRKLRVAARKPVQSFSLDSHAPTDADQLAVATGESVDEICPLHRWYPVAMAPPMAADKLGHAPLLLDALIAEIQWLPGIDVGLIETAGGVCSPISHDADCSELARRVEPDDVLLVADAGLGTINAVRLAVQALQSANVTVLLNRFDADNELHCLNRQWLQVRDGLRIITDATEMLA